MAGLEELAVGDLADEKLVIFPRQLAPRLYDALLAICHQGGFEPRIRRRAFHSAGTTGILASANEVALAPESVGGRTPGMLAVPLADADAQLDTFLIRPRDDLPAAARRFCDVARVTFHPTQVR